MGAFAKFFFRPGEGERVHTTVETAEDTPAGIYGTVTRGGTPAQGAAVLLFDGESGELTASCSTDSDGGFAFASLEGGRPYLAKIYVDGVKLRELEIVV